MTKAKTIVSNLTRAMGIESGVRLFEIQRQWCDLFDANINNHTYPFSLNNGILTIIADSPIWLQEIRLHKHEIINKISSFYVKDIRVKLGVVKAQMARNTNNNDQEDIPKQFHTPTWALPMLEELKDNELRESLQRIVSIISDCHHHDYKTVKGE
ncbi:MAG: DUF721 domain-containing protein [Thermodesulfovibrionales bacterium]